VLIRYGRSGSALPIAARRDGQGNYFYDSHLWLGRADALDRSSDIVETIRVLVEVGDCDPMATLGQKSLPHNLDNMTNLHICAGLAELLHYMLRQDRFMTDVNYCPSPGYRLLVAYILTAWEYSAATTSLLLKYSRSTLSVSANAELLHFVVGKLRTTPYMKKSSRKGKVMQDIHGLMVEALKLFSPPYLESRLSHAFLIL
jgi:hypothetical protein